MPERNDPPSPAVNQATGVLIERLGVEPDEALKAIDEQADQSGQTPEEEAQEVVASVRQVYPDAGERVERGAC